MLRYFMVSMAAASLLVLTSCNGSGSGSNSGSVVKIEASGASFPSALYSAWFKKYREENPNVKPDYQSVGSGKGVTDFLEERSDIGASDAAMNESELADADKHRGAILLPMTAGAIVVAYHQDLPKGLKLSRDTYAKIFLGEITRWNDSAIAATNEGVELPDQAITVVHRSDGSGTTYVFTRHLSTISKAFEEKIGFAKEVPWPNTTGFTAGPKNDGVASGIKNTAGSIGYIEYGFAQTADLPVASLENKAGEYIAPTMEAAVKAIGSVELPEDMIVWTSDPPGEGAYPIVTYTWMMAHKTYEKEKAEAVKKLLTWCLTDGQKMSEELHFIPLPENVAAKVISKVDEIQTQEAAK